MSKTPREIALGAVDRLCAWDGSGLKYEATAERAAEFQRQFILVMAERLSAAERERARVGADRHLSSVPDDNAAGSRG